MTKFCNSSVDKESIFNAIKSKEGPKEELLMKDLFAILFAGMDTTSFLVCSAMLELKRNPDVLSVVRSEVHDRIL